MSRRRGRGRRRRPGRTTGPRCPVINGYVNSLGYSVWDANTTDSATNLLNWAAHDIGILKRAPKIGVWMEKLPWNKGMKGHYGHAILVYGCDLDKKTLTV